MFRRPDLARHNAAVVRLSSGPSRTRAGRAVLALTLVAGAMGTTFTLPQAALAASRVPAVTFTKLALVNGWHTYPGAAAPAVADISGIITFKGSMQTSGTNAVAFTLPKAFRPATNVYVASALCSANKGRLAINRAGVVTVEAEGGTFSNAACVTSLDGVSFARSGASFTKLKLQNGWQNAPFGTSDAAARVISGTVHLKGAIDTHGTNPVAFTLPKGFRPASFVFVPVDLCNANKGRLEIMPSGVVHVSAEIRFSDAACFTSLDGVTFASSAKSFTLLKLQNGWTYYGGHTYRPAVRLTSGIVQFQGTIDTTRSSVNVNLFTLPKGMRPSKLVYIEIDLCNANNGRLYIATSGVVEFYAEGGTLQHAACFTSLDGAWFAR